MERVTYKRFEIAVGNWEFPTALNQQSNVSFPYRARSRGCMITFNVVKEQHGWAIRMGERMIMPFRSRDLAVREANCLADAIRRHGECTEVIIQGAEPHEPARGSKRSNSPSGDPAVAWAGAVA